MTDPKDPYHSVKIHIGELTTMKTLGIKTRSVEITLGNQKTFVLKNIDDQSEILSDKTAVDMALDAWEEITRKGHAKGYKFIEDIAEK